MKEFLRKISSRKLWAAIIGVAVGVSAAFGIDSSDYTQIAGIVTAAASVVSYIIGEAKIDAAGIETSLEIEAVKNPCGFTDSEDDEN